MQQEQSNRPESIKTIVIASQNPVKIEATLRGFRRMFPDTQFQIHAVSAASGVSEQPLSDAETLRGATNRAQNAGAIIPDADYWVGIEGGVEEMDGQMVTFAWTVIKSRQFTGKSRSGAFFLPEAVVNLIRQGNELGEADDIVFQRTDSKQQEGAIGILTGQVIDRMTLYEHTVILALLPFKNPELYATATPSADD